MKFHCTPWKLLTVLVTVAGLALLMHGCSAADPGDDNLSQVGGQDGVGQIGTGGGGGVGTADAGTQRWQDPDPNGESDATGGGGGNTGGEDPDPGDQGGVLGDPCADGDDCESGWCIPGPNGPVCSVPCTDSCPNGWDCKELQGAGGDPIYICVDPSARLCHPCLQNADCNQGLDGVHRCVDFGDAGSFCGLKCSGEGASCPGDTTCRPAGDDSSWQCIPPDGTECTCNGLAQALALKTQCHVTTEDGSCTGWRACGPDGLSDCAAPTPLAETCNGVDDDCDGVTDDDVPGLGGECEVAGEWGGCPGTTVCEGGGLTCKGTPAAAESCNGLDDDCDGEIDESYLDHDDDGVADCLDEDDDNDGVPDPEDCGPFSAAVFPGAFETCNGLDDDCDGTIDEPGAIGCMDRYRDIDGDTYGDLDAPMVCLCLPDPASYYTSTAPGDCDDLNPLINPGVQEVCDGIDNDCDGDIDETSLVDTDGDGLADCTDPDDDNDGYLDEVDCGPTTPTIYPGAQEHCNGIDDNCNGVTDELNAIGCTLHWLDVDDDGWGDDSSPIACLCGPSEEYKATKAGDCNDLDETIHPEASEACNGIDDDCDTLIDEDGMLDTDQDGIADCVDPDDDGDGWLDLEDCAPLNAQRYPGAPEVCNGLDDDCNGVADPIDTEGCTSHWMDADGDGYGSSALAPHCLCGPDPAGFYVVTNDLDCDDANPEANPEATEVCNYIDDNCDGAVDEEVASPCGGCSPTCVLQVGTEDNPYDSGEAQSGNVLPTEDGGITLASDTFEFHFIWIANSGEHTVSKLDTDTGHELARYHTCSNPSRTAVDLYGDCWVGCRNDGHVAKISSFISGCVDLNGDGDIDTSSDLNGDTVISGAEILPPGQDECVVFNVKPHASESCVRALGVDADNHAWIGLWNQKQLMRLEPTTGEVVQTISIPSTNPYGLAIDQEGTIWVAGRGGSNLTRVVPSTGNVTTMTPGGGIEPYGIAVDINGDVWIANYGGAGDVVWRYRPTTGAWQSVGTSNKPRGVAASADGHVYVANDGSSKVAKINVNTMQLVEHIELGGGRHPVGIAVDPKGFIWAVNQNTSSASKLDPNTYEVVLEHPVGSSPYTYSDMTGYALKTITTDQGFYRQVFQGWPGSETLWDSLVVEAELPGDGAAWLKVSYRLASTVVGLAAVPWNGPHGPFPPASFPLDIGETGDHIEVRLTLGTNDADFLPVLHKFTVIAFEQ